MRRSAPVVLCAVTLSACTGGAEFRSHAVGACADGAQLKSLLAADLDSDGRAELAVGCRTREGPERGVLEIWRSTGSGGFQRGGRYHLGADDRGEGANDLAVGDFDEDGRPDVAVADTGGLKHGVSVLHGAGEGRLEARGDSAYHPWGDNMLRYVEAVDANDDGHPDLAYAVNIGERERYVVGDGESLDFDSVTGGGAVPWRPVSERKRPPAPDLHMEPLRLARGDFDDDARVDLLVLPEAERDDRPWHFTLMLGSDAGHRDAGRIDMPAYPNRLVVADFDGDGRDDFAIQRVIERDESGPQLFVFLSRLAVEG